MNNASKTTTQQAIAQINQRLRNENIGVRIYLRGQRLYLRGSFPPKPHSKRDKSHQQDIALGYRPNPAGLAAVYKQAKLIEAQIINRVFDWRDYQIRNLTKVEPQTFQDWMLKFEEDFQTYSLSKNKKTRWKAVYTTLCKLPLDQVFTWETLETMAVKTIEDRPRKGSKVIASRHIQQFINFLKREGAL